MRRILQLIFSIKFITIGKYREFLLEKMPKNSICAEIDVWNGEVKKAVDEFSQNENIKKIQIKNGQFILQKI